MPFQRSVCLFTSALGSNSHKMDGGDGVELCFLACLPILSKPSFLYTILPEYTCHGCWRGGKKHLVKVGPKASL